MLLKNTFIETSHYDLSHIYDAISAARILGNEITKPRRKVVMLIENNESFLGFSFFFCYFFPHIETPSLPTEGMIAWLIAIQKESFNETL